MRIFGFLLLLGVATAAVIQHKLMHVESAMKRMIREGTWRDVVQARKNVLSTDDRAVGRQNLTNYLDAEYLANITVGTSEKSYVVVLDTGLANLYLNETTTADCDIDYCQEMGAFCHLVCDLVCCNAHSNSLHTSKRFNEESFNSQNKAPLSRDALQIDIVRLGDVNDQQLVVPNTTYTYAPSSLIGSDVDGFVGLAFSTLATDGMVPILINAINQGLLDQPLFTVYLVHNTAIGGYGGTVTYGAIDMDNCGEIIAYQPLSAATYYQFKMASVSIGAYSSSKNWDVISDTGTSFIMAPQVQADAIAKEAGATWDESNEVYWMDCNKVIPDLILTIGANQYPIQAVNFNVPIGDGQNCLLALGPFDVSGFGPTWLLGYPVLRQYCHIYDIGNQRIGFAVPKTH